MIDTIDIDEVTVISEPVTPVVCPECGGYITDGRDSDGSYQCYACGLQTAEMGIDYTSVYGHATELLIDPVGHSWFVASDRPRWHLGEPDETVTLFPRKFAFDQANVIVNAGSPAFVYELSIDAESGGIAEFDEALESDEAIVAPDVAHDLGSAVLFVKRAGFSVSNRWKVTENGAVLKNRRR